METNIKTIILFLSIVTTALSAGLFYAWMVSVIPGTKKIPNQAFIEVMQSINREILNPWFFAVFFGSIVLLLASTVLHYQVKGSPLFYLILSATLIYLIGTIGVTMFGNVPLNNMLESFDLSTFTATDYERVRLDFEQKWNQLNSIRTFAALASFLVLLYAVFKH